MKDLYRVVQSQWEDEYSSKATETFSHAKALDDLLEEIKINPIDPNWDKLIVTQFRYPTPVNPMYQARFRPPYFSRNSWYGTYNKETAFYEASYHFMKQRIHLPDHQEKGHRTLFVVECDISNAWDIINHNDISKIMDRNSWVESHEIAKQANNKTGILYPSCRDPHKKYCAAMYELNAFSKEVKGEWVVNFNFDRDLVEWSRHKFVNLSIKWIDVR